MSLKETIRNNALSGTAQQVLTALTAKSIEVRDDELYTWAGVALIAGPQGAEALRLALESNGMGWAVHQLGGSGIQLSSPLVQQALMGFAQAGVPGCSALAAVGIHSVSIIDQAGIATPTLQDVQAALDSIALDAEKDSLRQAGGATYNAYVAAVDAWTSGPKPKLILGSE